MPTPASRCRTWRWPAWRRTTSCSAERLRGGRMTAASRFVRPLPDCYPDGAAPPGRRRRIFMSKPEDVIAGKPRPFTGAEYLESLRDGREVWIYGERVDDVTTHPAFRNAARSLSKL